MSTHPQNPGCLPEWQEEVAWFRQAVEDAFPTPSVRDSMAFVIEEAIEVQRALMKGGYADGHYLRGNKAPPDVAGELGDLLFMVITLANGLGVDLNAATHQTLEKIAGRVRAERQRRMEAHRGRAE